MPGKLNKTDKQLEEEKKARSEKSKRLRKCKDILHIALCNAVRLGSNEKFND